MPGWRVIGAVALTIVMIALATTSRAEQSKSAPPLGMTQQQYDGLVDAISQAVADRLKQKDKIAPAKTTPADAATTAANDSSDDEAGDRAAVAFFERANVLIASLPTFLASFRRFPALLNAGDDHSPGAITFTIMLIGAVAAILLAESAMRWLSRLVRVRLCGECELARLWPVAGLAGLDLIDLAVVGLTTYGLIGEWFGNSDGRARFAVSVLSGVFTWRLYMFIFRIVFRPGLPAARLVQLDERDASAVYWRLSVVVLSFIATRIIVRLPIALGAPDGAIAAGGVLGSLVILATFVWAAWQSRREGAQWFSQLIRPSILASVQGAVAENWLVIAIPFFVLLAGAQIRGVLGLHFEVSTALILTLNLIIALILLETLLQFIHRRLGAVAEPGVVAAPNMALSIANCARMAAIVLAIALIARAWLIDVIGLTDQRGSINHSILTAAAAVLAAYYSWEAVRFVTDRYLAQHTTALTIDAEEGPVSSATRLTTLMPLMRMAFLILVTVVAGLIVVSDLGVNITPLLAGASVFGLAVSFGSQALVRDIVSGIFYLADDAFRVGEYIDCGKAKGTVEGFTLRSIRLRHQNGQIHTIPFGQLGQVTNFSRDWTTMKFNLRLHRDTDLEKLRKLTKRVGAAMMEEDEFKHEFLQPLKLQGVADILENALVMRFKFTSRPNMPTYIQREAIKRLFAAFQSAGIQFANATVSVQTVDLARDAAAATAVKDAATANDAAPAAAAAAAIAAASVVAHS
jgi:small-conductance mechanosensitive channel